MADPNELLDRARQTIGNSHSPYSGFRVAAVLEDDRGGLHTGVNVENSSYGLTVCAERVALFCAVSRGVRDFSTLMVYSPDGRAMPCGACLQVLAEFCGSDFPVIVATDGSMEHYTLSRLLPHPFPGGG